MLRVVLADDERKVIFLLRELIDWDKMGYEIAGVAHDGLRALELISEKQPHLLVTDIRMPGCSGIDLIRQAKERKPDLHCIIISGYREFEYAQSALKYGVEDYLLKPLKKEELSNLLIRLRTRLGEEEQLETRRIRNEESRQEQFVRDLRQAALRLLYQEPAPVPSFPDVRQIQETCGLDFPVPSEACGGGKGTHNSAGTASPTANAPYSLFAILVRPDIPDAEGRTDSCRILLRHALDSVRRNISRIASVCAAAQIPEGIAAVLCCQPYDPAELRRCMTRIRKEIEQQRDLFGDLRTCITVGSRRTKIQDLPVSMAESVWLCTDRICTANTGSLYRDAEAEEIRLEDHFRMDIRSRKALQEAAEYLDEKMLQKALRDSFCQLRSLIPHSGCMVREWYEEAVRVTVYGMEQNSAPEPAFADDLCSRFWFCRTEEDAFRFLEQRLCDRIHSLRERKSRQESRPIADARKYILEHFDQPIRLEDVSDYVGFNATYFSTLFKKETGQGFTDYLAGVRVERAKDLLSAQDLPLLDVCERVGYKDLKYFSRLFKKITGISPSDYRKLYR